MINIKDVEDLFYEIKSEQGEYGRKEGIKFQTK